MLFRSLARAQDHVVGKDQLRRSFGPGVASMEEFKARGAVFLQEDGRTDELFIGIHYDQILVATLEGQNPLVRLENSNLDAFCTLVEEVSHFHLILNRQSQNRGVSKLELEWQGEIDKLLLCATLLEAQSGDLHLSPLAQLLFDSASIVSANHETYWQATKHAARFWFAMAHREQGLTPKLREILRQSYQAPWTEKRAHLGRVA